jgi:hypothetical protein
MEALAVRNLPNGIAKAGRFLPAVPRARLVGRTTVSVRVELVIENAAAYPGSVAKRLENVRYLASIEPSYRARRRAFDPEIASAPLRYLPLSFAGIRLPGLTDRPGTGLHGGQSADMMFVDAAE